MELVGKNLTFKLVKPADAAFILQLRLDPCLNQYISKTNNNIDEQVEWIKRYQRREKRGQEYYFMIWENQSQTRIGTVRLYGFTQKRYNAGSLILKRGLPPNYFIEVHQIANDFAFEELGFHECVFACRRANQKNIRFNTRFGAQQFDEDELNIYFKFDKKTFKKNRKQMLALVNLDVNAIEYQVIR